MISSLRAAPSKALPISITEFSKALRALQDGRTDKTIGLAISGGVDSMALASLCANLRRQKSNDYEDLSFRAFVVDHSLRKDSNDEAVKVQDILHIRGIPTSILKIDWPQDVHPSQMTNFESMARKYRYQTLGKACRDYGIQSLLLAHHEDDQVETVLMRLVAGHRSSGLIGMKESSEIPECFGIHGVGRSGSLDSVPGGPMRQHLDFPVSSNLGERRKILKESFGSPRSRNVGRSEDGSKLSPVQAGLIQNMPSAKLIGPLQFEKGGIKIFRPLLHFRKDRLKATCLDDGMPWFEDSTNIDPTLTPRNAIRHILGKCSLPVALQPPSVLALARELESRVTRYNHAAQKHFESGVQIRSFEPRVGSLIVRFNFPPQDAALAESLIDTTQHQQNVAIRLLREVVECVSSESNISLSKLRRAQSVIFPHLNHGAVVASHEIPETTFAIAGVLFSRLIDGKYFKADDGNQSDHQLPGYHNKNHEWVMIRQPYAADAKKQPHLILPPNQTLNWSLYDGRYWIRLANCTSDPLYLRPFRKSDLKAFRMELGRKKENKLLRLLKAIAPGDIRWLLPAIVSRGTSSDRVLALPTLGIGIAGVDKLIRYQIRYKKVDNKL